MDETRDKEARNKEAKRQEVKKQADFFTSCFSGSFPLTSDFLLLFSIITASCTFFLIIAGALVTSTGSGLAVPDWPLSFGQFFPSMVGGVLFEHGHRMIAGVVAGLTAILAVLLWFKEERGWVCWLGTASLLVVLMQAVLGGITVLYGLPQAVSTVHAVLAQTFFCLAVSMAVFTSKAWMEQKFALLLPSNYKIFAVITTFFIYAQLILGAILRHGGTMQFFTLHVFNAVFVSISIAALAGLGLKYLKNNLLFFIPSILLTALIVIQLLLGIVMALPMIGHPILALAHLRTLIVTAHVAIGALMLASALFVTLWSFRKEF